MYCTSTGQIPGQKKRAEGRRDVKMPKTKQKKTRRGLHLIHQSKEPGEGRKLLIHIFYTFDSFSKKLNNSSQKKKEKSSTVLFECVTLCWSASEGLSPQLGKEASLLPSNTIHTLLTLPPTVLSPPVHSHPDTSSPPTTSLHG